MSHIPHALRGIYPSAVGPLFGLTATDPRLRPLAVRLDEIAALVSAARTA